MITAKVIASSINPTGQRITTFLLTYPRFIHSEFMTHRCFSRNSSSSRAIPFKKILAAIGEEPAFPERWPGAQAGMQGGEPLTRDDQDMCESHWFGARDEIVHHAEHLDRLGLHKSVTNRLLEPWMHMTVLATATDVDNFFNLRAHPAAQPEFQVLAFKMLAAYLEAKVEEKQWGEWHIPLPETMCCPVIVPDQRALLKIATAYAARVSYTLQDVELNMASACELHDRLVAAGHWSPFEHCAMAQPVQEDLNHKLIGTEDYTPAWMMHDQGNFKGWTQYRKHFFNENSPHTNLIEIMERKPDWIKL